MPRFPCKICHIAVAKNHIGAFADICKIWLHIKCNNIHIQTYNMLKNDKRNWYCIDCTKKFFPFITLKNNAFLLTTKGKKL